MPIIVHLSGSLNDWGLVNDRIGVKRDSAETEASARSTEASAEASAESLATNCVKMRQIFSKIGYIRKSTLWQSNNKSI